MFVDADDTPHSAADNGIDFRFITLAIADSSRKHLIPVQRPVAKAGRNKEVAFCTEQKGKTAFARLYRSAYQTQLFRKDISPALIPDQLAASFQITQDVRDLTALRPRMHTEQAADLFGLFIQQPAVMKLFPNPIDRRHSTLLSLPRS